jgi:hypothetical protein
MKSLPPRWVFPSKGEYRQVYNKNERKRDTVNSAEIGLLF